MTKTDGRELGQRRAERGIKRAAFKHRLEIERDTLKFLDSLLSSSTGCATLDDAADSLRGKYLDGGKWRASIPKRLKADGLIVYERVVKSARLARHAGYSTEWRLIDRNGAERYLAELLAAQAFDNPPEDAGESTGIDSPALDSITHTPNGEKNDGKAI